MQERNDLNRPLTPESDDLDRAGDHAREAGHHVKEAGRHAAEAMEAGASGTLERTADAARTTGRAAGHAASTAAGAVADTAKHAGEAVGHAASSAAHAAGAAFGAVTDPVRGMASRIADKVGGWWGTAKHDVPEVPEADREALLVLLETVPSDEILEDVAAAAYTLGYMAAQNPDYRGRRFDEVEPDVRSAYSGDSSAYGTWRDYTAHGYERGSAGS
jgi:hypothetical protein